MITPARKPVLRDTPVGKLWLYEHDLIGMTLAGGQFWDGDLLLPLFDEVPAGTTVVNLGAYTGYEAIYLAEKRGARVIAVEANLELYQMMLENLVEHNTLPPQVIPVHHVAYDHEGRFKLAPFQEEEGHVWEKGNVGSLTYVRDDKAGDIPGGPIDEYVFRHHPRRTRVSLIECDLQGADLRALEGLEWTIGMWRPVIVFEYEAGLSNFHGDDWRDYLRFFSRHRYDVVESKTHPRNFVARPR